MKDAWAILANELELLLAIEMPARFVLEDSAESAHFAQKSEDRCVTLHGPLTVTVCVAQVDLCRLSPSVVVAVISISLD